MLVEIYSKSVTKNGMKRSVRWLSSESLMSLNVDKLRISTAGMIAVRIRIIAMMPMRVVSGVICRIVRFRANAMP